MVDDNTACCAHMRVEPHYTHGLTPGLSGALQECVTGETWRCRDCHHEFTPKHELTRLRAALAAAVSERVMSYCEGCAIRDDHVDALKSRLAKAVELVRDMDTAMTDWLNLYASELCDPERVGAAMKRIYENGGTLAYIATLHERAQDLTNDKD